MQKWKRFIQNLDLQLLLAWHSEPVSLHRNLGVEVKFGFLFSRLLCFCLVVSSRLLFSYFGVLCWAAVCLVWGSLLGCCISGLGFSLLGCCMSGLGFSAGLLYVWFGFSAGLLYVWFGILCWAAVCLVWVLCWTPVCWLLVRLSLHFPRPLLALCCRHRAVYI